MCVFLPLVIVKRTSDIPSAPFTTPPLYPTHTHSHWESAAKQKKIVWLHILYCLFKLHTEKHQTLSLSVSLSHCLFFTLFCSLCPSFFHTLYFLTHTHTGLHVDKAFIQRRFWSSGSACWWNSTMRLRSWSRSDCLLFTSEWLLFTCFTGCFWVYLIVSLTWWGLAGV